MSVFWSGEKSDMTPRKAAQPLKMWVCQRDKVQKLSDTIDQNEHGDPERHALLTAITNYWSDRGNADCSKLSHKWTVSCVRQDDAATMDLTGKQRKMLEPLIIRLTFLSWCIRIK